MLGIAGQFLHQRGRRDAGELRRRGIHHRERRAVAVERLVELVVALAPIELVRNQRVDVSIDLEILGGVVAPGDRQDQRDKNRNRGEPRTSFNDRYDNTCQHI